MTTSSTSPTPSAAPRSPAEVYAHTILTALVLVGSGIPAGPAYVFSSGTEPRTFQTGMNSALPLVLR